MMIHNADLALEFPVAYERFLTICEENDMDPDAESFDEYMREVAAER